MARYKFGTFDLSGLPPYDKAKYPFLHIGRKDDGSSLFAYALAAPGVYVTAEDHVSVTEGSAEMIMTSYYEDTDTWNYIDDTVWLESSATLGCYKPVWTSYDMYDDTGALHMAGSAPLLIMDEDTLKVGISIGMSLKGKGSGGADGATYVVGDPVTFTLAANGWNGSMYTLYAYLYAAGENGVQIGLPSGTSNPNAQAVVEAALTIHSTSNYAGSTSAQPYCRLCIVAVEPPTEDIEIAVFGLSPVADTVVATAAVEDETETEETE